jgi:hypothetical protein
MLNTADNRQAVAALLAIARHYVQRLLISPADARATIAKIEPAIAGVSTGVVVVALVILLLKGLGVADPFDESRLRN